MRRNRFTVRWSKSHREWILWRDRIMVNRYAKKSTALQVGVFRAKLDQPSQLVSFGKDGRIQWERTYPRSSDPRRHKG